MTVTFLGTGTSQGVPVIACDCDVCTSIDYRDKRSRTSAHLQVDGLSIVIDTGPDFRMQMLRERVKWLDAILFTHEHKDHTAGMDDVRSFNFRQKMDIPVYARTNVIEQLKQEFAYVFADKKYPGIPQIQTHTIENKPFEVGNVQITPVEVMHHKLPVFGFRVKDFTYITDANRITAAEIDKVRGCKVVVLNALQKTDHTSHFTLKEAVDIAKIIGADQTYFTHISHKMGKHRDVEKELPAGMELAYDGLKLNI